MHEFHSAGFCAGALQAMAIVPQSQGGVWKRASSKEAKPQPAPQAPVAPQPQPASPVPAQAALDAVVAAPATAKGA